MVRHRPPVARLPWWRSVSGREGELQHDSAARGMQKAEFGTVNHGKQV